MAASSGAESDDNKDNVLVINTNNNNNNKISGGNVNADVAAPPSPQGVISPPLTAAPSSSPFTSSPRLASPAETAFLSSSQCETGAESTGSSNCSDFNEVDSDKFSESASSSIGKKNLLGISGQGTEEKEGEEEGKDETETENTDHKLETEETLPDGGERYTTYQSNRDQTIQEAELLQQEKEINFEFQSSLVAEEESSAACSGTKGNMFYQFIIISYTLIVFIL